MNSNRFWIRGDRMKKPDDERFMRLAIREAKKGLGRTSPNPCVGAVIVNDGRVIGSGYHRKAGSPHAEINAIQGTVENLKGATIYVTLEPCSHTGKTPPCCHAIVEAGFTRVVVGMSDPNPLVNGRGINYLRDHDLEVECGVLTAACEELNYPFIKYITQAIPWMIMKAGISLDGRLNYKRGRSGWITGKESGEAVHQLRDTVDAIMVGANTVKIDNPSLTCRMAEKNTKDPVRIILDSWLTTDLASKVYNLDSDAPTWVACCDSVPIEKINIFQKAGIRVIPVPTVDTGISLHALLKKLGELEVLSVLVEGGATLHGALVKGNFYDFAYLFYAPILAGDGGVPLISGASVADKGHAPFLKTPRVERYGEDLLISGHFDYHSS